MPIIRRNGNHFFRWIRLHSFLLIRFYASLSILSKWFKKNRMFLETMFVYTLLFIDKRWTQTYFDKILAIPHHFQGKTRIFPNFIQYFPNFGNASFKSKFIKISKFLSAFARARRLELANASENFGENLKKYYRRVSHW